MQVNGTLFNVELIDVLTELRSQLSMQGITRFQKIFDSGEDCMTQCPYHKDGQERRPSCGIRKSDGTLHCLACGTTVGLDEMIANCFGRHDPVWGYQWLTKNFVTVSVQKRGELNLDLSRSKSKIALESPQFVPDEELDSYRYTHPYLYERDLTDEIIERFDIGYDKASDSITFPVRYWGSINFGKCMFVAKRSVKTKRFDIPKGVEKPLYGTYEIWNILTNPPLKEVRCSLGNDFLGSYTIGRLYGVNEIYVCEGLFDALRLWCNGKIAVAGFGCLFSDYQITQLEGLPTRKLVLATDADKAGMEARQRIRKAVRNKLITEVILPPGRKDIGECTDEEINNLNEVF